MINILLHVYCLEEFIVVMCDNDVIIISRSRGGVGAGAEECESCDESVAAVACLF